MNRFSECRIVVGLRAGDVEEDVERNRLRATLREAVDERRMQRAWPGPWQANLGERRLVDRDDDDARRGVSVGGGAA